MTKLIDQEADLLQLRQDILDQAIEDLAEIRADIFKKEYNITSDRFHFDEEELNLELVALQELYIKQETLKKKIRDL